MRPCLRVLVVLSGLACLCTSLTEGLQKSNASEAIRPTADTYVLIERVVDSLRDPQEAEQAMTPNDTTWSDSELAGLVDLFPYSDRYQSDSTTRLRLTFPPHEYLSSPEFRMTFAHLADGHYRLTELIVDESDEGMDSSGAIAELSDEYTDESIRDLIRNRLALYRSLVLPQRFWLPTASPGERGIIAVHGNNIDTLYYDNGRLLYALNRLYEGRWCYVDLVTVDLNQQVYQAQYVSIVTSHGAEGNHLVEITEYVLASEGEAPTIDRICVDLYPYIRLDNVQRLMKGTPDSAADGRFDLYIKRREP